MNNEPVLTGAAIVGLINAFIVMLLALNIVNWTPEQMAGVMAFVTALVGVVAAAVRSRVTPVPKTQQGI